MKRIYLIRHAKSSWEVAGIDDLERPLLKKGIKRTEKITQYLEHIKAKADAIISSPAVRTMETAKIIAASMGFPSEDIVVENTIYFGEADSYFDVFYGLPDAMKEVFIVGHNPNITQFANKFLSPALDYLPTSGMVGIDFKIDKWIDLPNAAFEVAFVVFPKMIE